MGSLGPKSPQSLIKFKVCLFPSSWSLKQLVCVLGEGGGGKGERRALEETGARRQEACLAAPAEHMATTPEGQWGTRPLIPTITSSSIGLISQSGVA